MSKIIQEIEQWLDDDSFYGGPSPDTVESTKRRLRSLLQEAKKLKERASRNPSTASVMMAIAFLCQEDSEVVYHAMNAAKEYAMRQKNFEVAAHLLDLRKGLTGNWEPSSPPADELRAMAGV